MNSNFISDNGYWLFFSSFSARSSLILCFFAYSETFDRYADSASSESISDSSRATSFSSFDIKREHSDSFSDTSSHRFSMSVNVFSASLYDLSASRAFSYFSMVSMNFYGYFLEFVVRNTTVAVIQNQEAAIATHETTCTKSERLVGFSTLFLVTKCEIETIHASVTEKFASQSENAHHSTAHMASAIFIAESSSMRSVFMIVTLSVFLSREVAELRDATDVVA